MAVSATNRIYLPNPDRNKKCEVVCDELRASTIKQIFEKVAHNGWSGRKIFQWLRDEVDFRTKNNKHLTLSNVYLILKNTFYYGEFEYPKGGGTWYKGKHTPIITKDLFMKAQNQIHAGSAKNIKRKEFAFTKLMTCGLCGSGITADEKFKKLKDGSTRRYVYYGCTKYNDKNCPGGYIREEELIEQLITLFDTISFDEIGMKDEIKQALEAHNEFQEAVLGKEVTEKTKVKEIDIRNYAKFIFKKKPMSKKRELLDHLKSTLMLKEKKIYLD